MADGRTPSSTAAGAVTDGANLATLINGEAVLDSTGLGSGGASIGNDVTAEMLQAYRAWRYLSVPVYSAGHADLVGVHSAIALNLAKFGAGGPVIDIALSAAGIGPNFNRPEVAGVDLSRLGLRRAAQ